MGHFVNRETELITLDETDWVKIKKEMSYGDTQRLASAFMKMRMQKKGDVDSDIDFAMGNIELLAINIVDWSFTDENGKKIEITNNNIKDLKPSTAEIILTAIGEKNNSPKA